MSEHVPPPHRTPDTGTPRWVKVFGLIAVVVLLVAVAILLAGGEHGPGRHGGIVLPPAQLR